MSALETLNHIIRTRRSNYPKFFTEEVIDDKHIELILENANYAPNHKLTQPWRFTVFTGEGLKKLSQFQSDLYKELSKDKFDEMKYQKLIQNPLQCSHVIALGVEPNPIVPEIEEIEAVACAVQNMSLTAAALELGCYWGSGGITYKKEANQFFNLSEKGTLLGFLFLGIPKQESPSGTRKPIENFTNWIR